MLFFSAHARDDALAEDLVEPGRAGVVYIGVDHRFGEVAETAAVLRMGANEIDMVLNVGALRGSDFNTVRSDIAQVVEKAHHAGAIVKVILETAVLDDTQKAVACLLAKEAGARNPAELARQLMLLYDGAAISAWMDHTPSAATAARSVATALVDAAISKTQRTARGPRR